MVEMGEPAPMAVRDIERILDVARDLAKPRDLQTLLSDIVDAVREVLNAERGSVFLHDPATGDLYTTVATGTGEIRVPPGRGIAGECAQTRAVINVPDCYEDPRFDRSFDARTGYRTRSMLAVPLIGHDDALVGVMQVLNRRGGPFRPEDQRVATALAAQCAVALQRHRLLAEMVEKEKMRRELEVAREIQMCFLPRQIPEIPGYEITGWSRPADLTGGDVFDAVRAGDDRAVLLLGDATGHGVGPALSVTQVRSMLRMAIRLNADLDATARHINDQLSDDLTDNRFVTVFLAVLDASTHRMRYHAAGQAPILHLDGATGDCRALGSTTMPMGLLDGLPKGKAVEVELGPGDVFAVLTDGIYERESPAGDMLGTDRVVELLREYHDRPIGALADAIVDEADRFGAGSPQADDMTILLIRRRPA